MRRILCVVLVMAMGAGCAPVQVAPLDPGEELAIVYEKRPEAQVTNTDIGKGAAVGVAGGAVAGFAYGAVVALACGPFYALCLPGSIAATTATGAVAGGLVGGTVGVMIGISEEDKKKLVTNLAQLDAQLELAKAIDSRAKTRWKLVPPPAPNELIVRLDKIDLRASGEKDVSLAMSVTVFWKDKDDPRPQFKTYEYLGSRDRLSDWVENRDGFLEKTFERGSQRIADDLIADLEGKSKR